ncbi:MAG: gliding motility-associated C-terminal domain-containing protein [Bacteroidia bacterium]
MKKLLFCFFYSLYSLIGFAQGEGNHWYFGFNAGLDFTSGSPIADLNGGLSTWEGCSSVSDRNGNLLFYTDGSSVYTSNHTIMPNGTGLLGNSSSTQSAVIVKKPGTDTLYYIFTTPAVSTGGLYYSEVNMNLNGGLGDIVVSTKNTNLLPIVGERVTATKHSNGVYTWVITKRTNTSDYYAYLINCQGIQTPIVTTIGLSAAGLNAGSTVVSPNGKKVASTFFTNTVGIEILDFDNSTGILSNAITQTLPGTYPYGACFSSNSNLFYYSDIGGGNITQLDLTAGGGLSTAVLASSTVIGNVPYVGISSFRCGALQLGPDSKIYVAENGMFNISVINSPNTVGIGSNFTIDAISLNGKQCGLGLPALFLNFIDTAVINYNSACLNSPSLFSLNGDSTSIDSVYWSFGDPGSGINNNSTLFSPSHTYSSAGNYTIQVIRYFQCGSDTNSIQINVTPNSVLATITGPDSVCSGQSIQLTGSGGFSYQWLGPNGFSDTAQTINLTNYTQTAQYTLIASDNSGCKDTAYLTPNAYPSPTAIAMSNNPVPVGDSIIFITDTIAGISWSGPNGFTSLQQNPIIPNAQLSNAGTYQLIKTNSYGCSDTAQVLVNVYQPEIPDNTIDDDNDGLIDCADPDLATLSQCYKCGYDSIAWKVVEPELGFNKGIAIKYTGFEQHFIVPTGVTSIKVKAWGAGGGGGYSNMCDFAAGAGGYSIDQLTTVAGETYIVVTGEGGWVTRHINQTARATFGGGGSGNSEGASATAEVGSGGGLSGLFISTANQANARVIAGGGGGIGDATGFDPTSGGNGNNPLAGGHLPLTGQNAIVNSTGFGGGGGGYVGGISGIGRFSCNIQLPETTADGGEGGSGFVYTSNGQIKFTPELNIYPPDTSDIHYIPGVGVGKDYNMAIGAIGDIKAGGDGLVVIQWFEPIEDLTISASKTSICNGDTLTLTASGNALYAWTPSATLSNDTAKIVIANPNSTTTYEVISNKNNCLDTAQIEIIVNPVPTSSFVFDTVCFGENTTFTNASTISSGTITNLQWTFGDNTTPNTTTNPTYLYTTCGNFNVLLAVTSDSGCVDSTTQTIIVKCLPIVNAGIDDTVCFSESTVLQATPNGTGYSFSWSAPSNNNFSIIYNPSVNPTITTSYTVNMTDANGCSDTDTVIIFADTEINVSLSTTNITCNGLCNGEITSTITGGNAPYTYNWSNSSIQANNGNLCVGSYSLTVTDSWGCLSASVDTSITEPILLTATIDTSIHASCFNACDGTASVIAAGGTSTGSYTYLWNTSPTQSNTIATNLCAGEYIITITDNNLCEAKDTVTINQPNLITINDSTTPSNCNDSTGTATVVASGGTPGYSFSWSVGNSTTATINNLPAGQYTVTVVDTNGCTQLHPVTINNANGPIATINSTNTSIMSGSTVLLSASGVGNYLWTPTTTLSCDTCTNTEEKPKETTTYCVSVTDTNGCADTACITIEVDYLCDLSVPNAFSPNNDGRNDLFVISGWEKCVTEFSIRIYNRWGEKVFETDDLTKSWDGKYKTGEEAIGGNQKINSAVFVYYIQATLISGEKIIKQGNISVIR